MSYLIIGGTKEERKQKAIEISNSQFLISNFDTILVEGETSIGIEQIRNLHHNLSFKPYDSPAKAAIIHPAEILTIEAQNALLKTLEDPPAGGESSIIILTAPQLEVLLPTVVSRCQIVNLPAKSEIELNEEEFNSIFNFQFSIFNAGVGERLKMAAKIATSREEVISFLDRELVVLRKLMLEKYITDTHVHPKYVSFSPTPIIRQLSRTKEYIEQNVNPRLALEVFFLDLPHSDTPEVYHS